MRVSSFCLVLFGVLFAPALIGTLYLYLYPLAHGCAFPTPTRVRDAVYGEQQLPELAPFRLLALGDPQLEGDTSLPDPDAATFPSLHSLWHRVEFEGPRGTALGLPDDLRQLWFGDLRRLLHGYRKRLDLWGNDLYLAHVYRTISWWTEPSHTVVLGDLLGSQWISDIEFKRRAERFWQTVFRGGKRVPDKIMETRDATEILGEDQDWKTYIMTLAGNHDIGYAGDINTPRTARFEEAFGKVNWDITFRIENNLTCPSDIASDRKQIQCLEQPELRLVLLNSMNLDEPAWDKVQQDQSRRFVADRLHARAEARSTAVATVLLTHIPFYKEAGVCVDAPFFDYFLPEDGAGIKEQNHLSESMSNYILDGLVAGQQQGQAVVLNGHDHEGCQTIHRRSTIRRDEEVPGLAGDSEHDSFAPWIAQRYAPGLLENTGDTDSSLREITVRSMMGSYGGNAGLLSGWFDWQSGIWQFEYSSCSLGVQHIWWAVHVLNIIALVVGIVALLTRVLEVSLTARATTVPGEKAKKA